MAKAKKLGAGSFVKISGTKFDFLEEVTPSEISRTKVDTTCIDDADEDFLDSDPPSFTTVKLMGFIDPDSAEDIAIRTFMKQTVPGNRETTLAIYYRKSATGTPPVWTYNIHTYTGRLLKIAPSAVKRTDKIMVEIEFQPKGDYVATTGAA